MKNMFLKQFLAPKICQGKPVLLLTGLVICMLAGCAANERVFKKGDLTLIYRHKTTSSAELKDIELAHPLKISQKKVADQLLSLAYKHNAILSKGKLIFTRQQAEKHSKIIAKALNKASPNNVIYIEMDSEKGTTVVELFASYDKLNWKFDAIHGIRYSKNKLKGWGSTWRLIPQKGQSLFASQKLLGTKTWDNWIVAELELPEKKLRKKKRSKKRSAKTKKTAPVEIGPELVEKLKFLKHLKEKGLIDNEEYKRKRRNLLDQYF